MWGMQQCLTTSPKSSLAQMAVALDKACERLAMRSVGEAEEICNQLSVEYPNIAPAHFHLLATFQPFLRSDGRRDIVMLCSRLAHISALILEMKADSQRFSTEYMNFMVNSHSFYNEVMASERNREPKRLMKFGRKAFSQSDEDGLIEEVFRRIGERSRKFLEIGVQSGAECNTTNLLLQGWSGAWLECSENFVRMGEVLFRQLIASSQLRIVHQFVTAEGIDSQVAKTGLVGEIDLLSIDIDGNDIWVWKALSSIQPRVVIIEYNATYAPPLSIAAPYVADQVYGGTNYFGASLGALAKVGYEKGYNLVGCSFRGNNAIFVRKEDCGDLFLAPYTAEEHFEPIRYPVNAPWGYVPDFGPLTFV